jgi:hypothetical protein
MRHRWAWLALFLAVPAQAASLPASADQRGLTPDDEARLAALLDDHARTHPNGTGELVRQQQELSRQLLAELYSPSPDLSVVERLDLQIRELRRQILRAQDETTVAFYRGLNSEDRVKLMKMNYPLPATD